MKIPVYLLLLLLFMVACSKQNQVSTVPLNEVVDTNMNGAGSIKIRFKGGFMNGPYGTVKGTAIIYEHPDHSFELGLDSIAVSNGPDLHVYLSGEILPVNFIDLGKLRSTNGTLLYKISGSPDWERYKFVLIHCQQYNHLFGSAELGK